MVMNGTGGPTQELMRFAKALAARGENKVALVIDLTGIPEANDRVFFRSLVRFVEERTDGVPHDALPLARHFVALLADPDHAIEIQQRLTALSDYFGEHHHGSVRVQAFDLVKHASLFVNTCRQLMQQPPPPASERSLRIKDPAAPDMQTLDRFLQVQRVLRTADLSMLTRNQDIWVLRPAMAPLRMARELWLSIPDLERRIEIPVSNQPWLFGRTTELADYRLLAQLLRYDGNNNVTLCLNLHAATVFSNAFRKLRSQPTPETPRNLIVELSHEERHESPALFDLAVKELRLLECGVTLDGLKPHDLSTLTAEELDCVDWIKLDVGSRPESTANLSAQIERIGPERIILHHCDSDLAVRYGLSQGVQRFQGRGLQPLLDDPAQLEALLGPEAAENFEATRQRANKRAKPAVVRRTTDHQPGN